MHAHVDLFTMDQTQTCVAPRYAPTHPSLQFTVTLSLRTDNMRMNIYSGILKCSKLIKVIILLSDRTLRNHSFPIITISEYFHIGLQYTNNYHSTASRMSFLSSSICFRNRDNITYLCAVINYKCLSLTNVRQRRLATSGRILGYLTKIHNQATNPQMFHK